MWKFDLRAASIKGLMAALALLHAPAWARVTAPDASGQLVRLPTPARRIVSLAPHATELIFAAGGGAWLVGVTDFSDFPPAATRLPHVGSYQALDLERIVALHPDLVIAWRSGSPPAQVKRLQALGIPVFFSEPRRFEDIAHEMELLGRLLGTEATAKRAAADFRHRLDTLAARFAGRRPLRVFYQIWDVPLMTLNGEHLVSQALGLCGGVNVFAALPALSPQVTREAVIAARPEVILTGRESGTAALASWQAWTTLPAVARNHLYTVDGSLLNRPGPRIPEGTQQLCETLERARR